MHHVFTTDEILIFFSILFLTKSYLITTALLSHGRPCCSSTNYLRCTPNVAVGPRDSADEPPMALHIMFRLTGTLPPPPLHPPLPAPKLDYLLMLVGTVCAAGAGIVMPVFSIIFGDIIDAFHGPDPVEEVSGILCIRPHCYFFFLEVHAGTCTGKVFCCWCG